MEVRLGISNMLLIHGVLVASSVWCSCCKLALLWLFLQASILSGLDQAELDQCATFTDVACLTSDILIEASSGMFYYEGSAQQLHLTCRHVCSWPFESDGFHIACW